MSEPEVPKQIEQEAYSIGVDPYVYFWARKGDIQKLPEGMRDSVSKLTDIWNKNIEQRVANN